MHTVKKANIVAYNDITGDTEIMKERNDEWLLSFTMSGWVRLSKEKSFKIKGSGRCL